MLFFLVLYSVLLWGGCGYALWIGRKTERIAACAFICAALLSYPASLASEWWLSGWNFVFLIDVTLLGVLGYLALHSDRYWPLWATSTHLIAVMTHLAVLAAPQIVPKAYVNAEPVWAYPTLLFLIIGTWLDRRESRRIMQNWPG